MSADAPPQRGLPARVGLSALNIPASGLGLLRLGKGRIGAALILAPLLLLLAFVGLLAAVPTPSFAGAAIGWGVLAASLLAITVLSIVLTWRRGRAGPAGKSWWSRWYGLLAIWLIASTALGQAVAATHRFYKPFYMPAGSMSPTLDAYDRILVDMRGGRDPEPGDLILLQASSGIYVKRVAAIAGDRIAMRAGVPVVNGRAAARRALGRPAGEPLAAHLFRESVAGRKMTHLVLDSGTDAAFDDMVAVDVPAGHVFVLGDNRDNSADSRVPVDQGGVGMVALNRIVGVPLFIYWNRDRAKIGRTLMPVS